MRRSNEKAITIYMNKRVLKKRIEDFIVISIWLLVNLMDIATFLLSFGCIFAMVEKVTTTAIIILIICMLWMLWRKYMLGEK